MRNCPTRLAGFLAIAALTWRAVFGVETVFEDVTDRAGVRYLQVNADFHPEVEFPFHLFAGGVAVGDYDNDGWPDLFVTRIADPDILFRNTGTLVDGVIQFEDVSDRAGFTESNHTNGALWVDVDNDGDLDLYVTTLYSRNFLLYLNDGEGRFVERGVARGAALPSPWDHNGFSLAAGDFDKDGWTDIHTTEWMIDQTKEESVHHNVLLENLGPNAPGFFRNVTAATGTTLRGKDEGGGSFIAYGFTSNFADMDNDGWQDLLVVGDFKSSQIFWNNGDGTFVDGTAAAGIQLEWAGMGSAIADYDGDGWLDWFVASQSDNALYRNNGDRTFTSTAVELGVDKTGWSWATSWIDYDNDGDLDLFVTNGMESHDGHYQISSNIDPNYFFENVEGEFVNRAQALGVADEEAGKGMAVADFDNDGDLDIFIVNNGRYPVFYQNNQVSGNSWLRVKLRGHDSNPAGYGAKLYLRAKAGWATVFQELIGGNNYLGQNEAVCHFGLGPGIDTVFSLEIHWPGGRKQVLQNLRSNQTYWVSEPFEFEDWLKRFFQDGELADLSLSDSGADPDKDGINNFFEYAFGTNPRTRDADRKIILENSSPGTGEVSFTYNRIAGATDVAYDYEAATDLKTWTAVQEERVTGEILAIRASGRETVRVTLQGLEPSRQFIRVSARSGDNLP